jgi:hypothetical protein
MRKDCSITIYKDLQIEHIIPKNPADYKEYSKEEHEKYIEYLGNITLITKNNNGKIGNNNFSDKIGNYFQGSELKINQKIYNEYKTLSEKEFRLINFIKKRGNDIAEEICKIYQYHNNKIDLEINTDNDNTSNEYFTPDFTLANFETQHNHSLRYIKPEFIRINFNGQNKDISVKGWANCIKSFHSYLQEEYKLAFDFENKSRSCEQTLKDMRKMVNETEIKAEDVEIYLQGDSEEEN